MIKKYNEFIYEGIRDKMTPKSEEDIKKDVKRMTPQNRLKIGCEQGILWAVKDAIQDGADIEFFNGLPIQLASSHNYIDIVKYLIEQGADVHSNDDLALRWSCSYGYIDTVKLLLDNGANVNAIQPYDKPGDKDISKQMFALLKQYGSKLKSINEGVRDQMTPKSNDELKAIVDTMPNHKQYRYVMRYDIADLYNEDELAKIRNDYIDDGDLAGKRIRLIQMIDDPNPIQPGTEGTIKNIDGIGNIQVDWDNGRTLSLIPNVDQYEIIKEAHTPTELHSV